MIEYIAYTKKGDRREKNEDRIFIDNKILAEGTISGKAEDGLVAVVCDGVGGNAGGEIAAEIVANSFKDMDIPQMSVVSLNKHIQRTNREIMEEQEKHPNYRNMASTLAGMILWKNQYIFFNLGDTRIYEINDGYMKIKTKDHIVMGYEKKNYITHYMGGEGYSCNPYILKGVFKKDFQTYMICSDGLYNSKSFNCIEKSILHTESHEKIKNAILNSAIQNGVADDVSFLLLNIYDSKSSGYPTFS